MTYFLEGIIVGFLLGSVVAYVAFTRVTARMAKSILEVD